MSKIFNNKKVIIIAEACDNHFGDVKNAKKMVLLAKKAGADVIKFQHHLADEEMLKNVPKSSNFKMSLYNFLKKYSLKLSDHLLLKNFCKKIGIEYLCTPFSYKAAEELNKIGVKWFKVGSGEFTDTPFIKKLLKLFMVFGLNGVVGEYTPGCNSPGVRGVHGNSTDNGHASPPPFCDPPLVEIWSQDSGSKSPRSGL